MDRGEEAIRFLRILSGRDRGPRYDIVCLNAAPIFYLMGKAGDLRDGFRQAQDIINSGQTITKLREWVTAQNSSPEAGLSKLEDLLKESAVN